MQIRADPDPRHRGPLFKNLFYFPEMRVTWFGRQPWTAWAGGIDTTTRHPSGYSIRIQPPRGNNATKMLMMDWLKYNKDD